jgi:hypothetical protein
MTVHRVPGPEKKARAETQRRREEERREKREERRKDKMG